MKPASSNKQARTSKRAYHDILLPDGTLHQGPIVVETDREGHVVGWHEMQGEEPFTEWIGGTFSTSDCNLTC